MKRKLQRGTSTVEFAIVLPILLMIAFGIIEFSVALYDKAMVTNASREGARAGIVFRANANGDYTPLTDGEITTVVNNYLQTYLISLGGASSATTNITRAVNPSSGQFSPGGHLTVLVSYNYNFLVLPNFVAGLVGPLRLDASTVMRFE